MSMPEGITWMDENRAKLSPQEANYYVAMYANIFGVSASDLLGVTRTAEVCAARDALAISLWSKGWSMKRVGTYLNRSHSSVSRAIARAQRRMDVMP